MTCMELISIDIYMHIGNIRSFITFKNTYLIYDPYKILYVNKLIIIR
jgi:hypothetical protein